MYGGNGVREMHPDWDFVLIVLLPGRCIRGYGIPRSMQNDVCLYYITIIQRLVFGLPFAAWFFLKYGSYIYLLIIV